MKKATAILLACTVASGLVLSGATQAANIYKDQPTPSRKATTQDQGKDYSTSDITKVVLIGSGTPMPQPNHGGPNVAVVVNGQAYLVDAGVNIVRNAQKATPEYGGKVNGLESTKLDIVFITHLHSDHTLGLPDLMFSPWSMGRDTPMTIYGPEGIATMTEDIQKAWRKDRDLRLYGLEPVNNVGWRADTHEIEKPGIIYKDRNVTVEAIAVHHGSWPQAFAYKFVTPDRVIVISGDNSKPELLLEASKGADILMHEVYGKKDFGSSKPMSENVPFWKRYFASFHTRTDQLAKMLVKANPRLVVLYHEVWWTKDHNENAKEINKTYKGKVISGQDQDIF